MAAKVKDSGDALEDDFQASDTEYLSDGQDGGEQFDASDDENDSANAGSKRKAGSSAAPEAPKKKKQSKVLIYLQTHGYQKTSATNVKSNTYGCGKPASRTIVHVKLKSYPSFLLYAL